uniref:Putative secreted protein n=1 Tax=Rhipicephalus microplus TaxID=6941 RepID=A0A6M2DCK8_RHIMP
MSSRPIEWDVTVLLFMSAMATSLASLHDKKELAKGGHFIEINELDPARASIKETRRNTWLILRKLELKPLWDTQTIVDAGGKCPKKMTSLFGSAHW